MIPFPNKKYQIIYADPPWELKKGSPNLHKKKQGQRELDYPTMKIKDITEIPVIDIADKNAVLFMWTTNKYIEQTYTISRAWGFNPSTMIVWAKKPKGRGLGGVFGISTEYLLYSRRGSLKNKSRMWSTWYEHKRLSHSEKPAFFRDMISECFEGKKIELFARNKTEGWDVWGNEIEESPVLGEELLGFSEQFTSHTGKH